MAVDGDGLCGADMAMTCTEGGHIMEVGVVGVTEEASEVGAVDAEVDGEVVAADGEVVAVDGEVVVAEAVAVKSRSLHKLGKTNVVLILSDLDS